jgi:mannan endo-1,4-beta-mannosidase
LLAVAMGAACVLVVVAGIVAVRSMERRAGDPAASGRAQDALPTAPGSYVGLYPARAPASYAGAAAFSAATGVSPNLVSYYSGWLEPFQTGFATTVAAHGATPLIQIDPTGIRLAAIAAGRYDSYLMAYAEAVRSYGHPVILSFGHEMNGDWYTWAHGHSSPAAFVAAWRHIVTIFRAAGARNVTWLWTVNVIETKPGVPAPGRWWPGAAYVTWVGIDGYYEKRSLTFDSLFGPTIVAVRALTGKPILIAETAAAPSAGQPAKIADLFASIHRYQLLGFVWFDQEQSGSQQHQDWRLSRRALEAFGQDARKYTQPKLARSPRR